MKFISATGALVVLVGVGACSAPKAAEFTLSTGTDSETSSPGTTGDDCPAGDFEILGECYHQIEVPEILTARSVVAGDFDGDEVTDLVMTCKGVAESFGICFLALDGTIVRLDLDWLRSGDGKVYAGDFNDDGIPEVLVSEMYHFGVFSLDQGAFVELSSLIYESADDVALEDAVMFPAIPIDVNNDGNSEVVAGSGFNGVQLWRFDGQNEKWVQAGERQALFGCGDLVDARVTDLDGDSMPDLLALGSHNNCDANLSPGAQWNRISMFMRKSGELELEHVSDFATELAARRFDVADFKGEDGSPDLIVAASENMMLFSGNGDGTFDSPIPAPSLAHFLGTGPHAGDYNGDGIDEVTVEQSGGVYNVLVGLPTPQIVNLPSSIRSVRLVADLNGDNHADVVSLSVEGEFPLVLTLSQP